MTNYIVTTRNKAGALEERAYTAETRAELFKQLAADGVTAVRIAEGVPGKKPRKASSGGGAKIPFKTVGLVAASLVALIAAVVIIMSLTRGEDAEPIAEKEKEEKIESTEQPIQPTVVEAPLVEKPKEEKKERVITPEEQKKLRPGDPGFDPAAHPTILIPKKKKEKVNSPFRNSVEQALSWIANCEPGDPPLPLILISPGDMKNLTSILLSGNPIQEGDTELVAQQREIIEAAKAEMRQYVKNGGDPQEFLKYFHDLRESQHMMHSEARNAIMNLLRDGANDDIAAEYIKRVNADLEAKGIKPVRLSKKKMARHGLDQEQQDAITVEGN